MHRITQEDLVQYMYKETSPEKTAAINAALQSDWQLKEQYDVLISGKQSLGKPEFSPSKKTLDAILQYAEKQVKEFTE